MAENYLFTTDAFEDYWRSLTDDGFLSMEHQFYMPRLVAEVMDALSRLGIDSPEEHFAVYALPISWASILAASCLPLWFRSSGVPVGLFLPSIWCQV